MARVHVNLPGFTHTESGKRKVWQTDAAVECHTCQKGISYRTPSCKDFKQQVIPTYCCSFEPVVFVWEKNTRHNGYNGYNGYVSIKSIEVLNQ